MMHLPSLCFRFLPYFPNFFLLHGKFFHFYLFPKRFPFSSAKISDDLSLVVDTKFVNSPRPIFPKIYTFPPVSETASFRQHSTIYPVYIRFMCFYLLYMFYLPPVLTMMRLCIIQYTCWTSLSNAKASFA